MVAPIAADVSGDGMAEVLHLSSGGFLHAFDADGEAGPGFPHLTGGWHMGAPAVGDIDGDGYLDVVTVTREGHLFAWTTEGRADQTPPWPMWNHDAQHTSNLHTPLLPQAGPLPAAVADGCGLSGRQRGAALVVRPAAAVDPETSMTPESPSDPELQTVEVLGGPIAYTDEGEGQPLVAVHGLPGSVRDFRWLAPALPESIRLLRVDSKRLTLSKCYNASAESRTHRAVAPTLKVISGAPCRPSPNSFALKWGWRSLLLIWAVGTRTRGKDWASRARCLT